MSFLASFLVTLGLLQLVSVYLRLRGLSLTGPLVGPGIIVGTLIFMGGVWLAVDEPYGLLLLYALVSLPIAVAILALMGILLNLGWDPGGNFLHEWDRKWSVENVSIPVHLKHIAVGSDSVLQSMPATYLKPLSWQSHGFESSGIAVLVICGAGDTRMTFKWRLFTELLEHGVAVLTIDPPGHGEFQHVPMTLANAGAASKAAVDWLSLQTDVHSIGGCGISFGGNQIAALAASDSRIKALVLISTPISLNPLKRSVYMNETLRLFAFPRNLGVLRDGSLLTHWREYRKLKGIWCGENLYEMITAFHMLETIPQISPRPLLFVHGTRDYAIPVRNSLEMYATALAPRDILLVRQANHVSVVLYPEEMRYVANWLHACLSQK